jgi:hypothetical protein
VRRFILANFAPQAPELLQQGFVWMTVKGNLSFLIDDSDNFAVGQCRLVVLIIDVAVAFCDWLSQCPVFISHYRQMTTTAYAQAVLAQGSIHK